MITVWPFIHTSLNNKASNGSVRYSHHFEKKASNICYCYCKISLCLRLSYFTKHIYIYWKLLCISFYCLQVKISNTYCLFLPLTTLNISLRVSDNLESMPPVKPLCDFWLDHNTFTFSLTCPVMPSLRPKARSLWYVQKTRQICISLL